MKKTVFKWGSISGLFLLISFLGTSFLHSHDNPNYEIGEIVGWTLIVLSLSCIVLGILAYRKENSGVISFGTALKLGMIIALFPTVAFVLYNWLYVTFIDPDFTETYYAYQLEKAEAMMDPMDFEAYKLQTEAEKEMFASPAMQAIVYFITNYLIGFIVSLIAALALKRKYKAGVQVT